MPARVARSNTQASSSKSKSANKSRKRNLDAFSIASHLTKPDKRHKIARHRLGESLEDAPQQKRRRVDDDNDEDGDSEDEDDDEAPRKRRPAGPDGDNDIEQGSDSDGNEFTLGGLADGDEDSDLDSDEAFGESDEEKFEGFAFRGSQKRSKRPIPTKKPKQSMGDSDIDLSEGEDEEEDNDDSFGDEGVDLATMLDDDEDDELPSAKRNSNDESEESESGESDDEDESSESEEDDDDADDGERIARLRDRLENLDEKPVSTAPVQESALSIDDLLADLDPSARSKFSAALKTKKKSAKPTTLSAPLPKRQQDRINREIASEKAKEQLDRWRDTVIHNRRAEFLSFPLKNTDVVEPVGKDKFVPDVPRTDLEQSIQQIMEESGLATNKPGHADDEDFEDAVMKSEELATNKLPVEEVMRRRAELRRQRELLFREEVKAKRIAKIKSKSYRRVHRKERERLAEKERMLMDPDGLGVPMDEDEQATMDRRRAEERMSTKHKESKWAKSLKATNRTAWDDGARDSVLEQARRNEELKRRIAGKDISDDEGSDVPSAESDSDDDSDDGGRRTLRQLNKLKQNDAGQEKGVGAMKFMKVADAKRRAQNDEDIERMRKELAIEDGDEDSSDEINDQGLGRAIFGPRPTETAAPPKPKRPELEEGDESGDDEEAIPEREVAQATNKASQNTKARGILKKSQGASGPLSRGAKPAIDVSVEPEVTSGISWLTDTGAKKSKKERQRDRAGDNETLIVTQTDNSNKKTRKVEKATEDPASKESKSAGNTDGWTTVAYKSEEVEGDASEAEDPILTAEQQKQSYHQRAFAGDDVHASFAAEKAAAQAEEDEQEISNHLPGWGSWTGNGLSKSIRKANARARHNPLFKTKLAGIKPEDRQDAKKGRENVIISEKKDRKGKAYLAPVLPRGFERKAEYERSLRLPIGPEWVTKETFQNQTRPRVVVKQGVIAPMERPLM
ncbi:Hypothetical protein R9X50_00319000 [Acrodontium crateriforme]|uniref:U3 small nucleolar RNA-associated protein 14 n=1 Tax=Acrodontium crateriforme TaxID=150365 RepID=A0AAQ3M335_9PEZI|nr:Hypothetical protein R9X50_00319000 [Acrodontium crateriforme]